MTDRHEKLASEAILGVMPPDGPAIVIGISLVPIGPAIWTRLDTCSGWVTVGMTTPRISRHGRLSYFFNTAGRTNRNAVMVYMHPPRTVAKQQ